MPARVLVTGADGFVGRHLVQQLVHLGHEVYAGVRGQPEAYPDGVHPVVCDLDDTTTVGAAVRQASPDAVVHLAAFSSVGQSWQTPFDCFRVNVMGTLTLLGELVAANMRPKVISVGSAEEYGAVMAANPTLTEDSPTCPVNPYGTSKLAQGLIALQFGKHHGFPVVHVRSFNHIGSGQRPSFVLADFARQVARIEAGLQPPVMRVGNLTAERDFLDVRDVARAYTTLIRVDVESGIYNVASGTAVPIRLLLDLLLEEATVSIEVVEDPALFRSVDVPVLLGSAAKLYRATSWQPSVHLVQTVRDALDAWRSQVRSEERRG